MKLMFSQIVRQLFTNQSLDLTEMPYLCAETKQTNIKHQILKKN